MRKRGRAIRPGALPSELHPLRKSLKKLRYGVEFVASLYPKKAVKRLVKRIKALQKSLGVINDAATATQLGERLAGGGHLELGVPVGALAQSREQASRAAMRKLGPNSGRRTASGASDWPRAAALERDAIGLNRRRHRGP